MNIAFFLTPKKDVIHLKNNTTMQEAVNTMYKYRYTAVPIINEKGKYVGTLTEGDLLYKLKKDESVSLKDMSNILVEDIPRYQINRPVSINSNIKNLINIAKYQNFVPVVDDNNTFIGIIKRSDIIKYCYDIITVNDNELKEAMTV